MFFFFDTGNRTPVFLEQNPRIEPDFPGGVDLVAGVRLWNVPADPYWSDLSDAGPHQPACPHPVGVSLTDISVYRVFRSPSDVEPAGFRPLTVAGVGAADPVYFPTWGE